MQADNEFSVVLSHLYEKNLILHDTALFDRVLYFFYLDTIAHIDYTCGLYAFNYTLPKNIMSGEYMRWRIDEEKERDTPQISRFCQLAEGKIYRKNSQNFPRCGRSYHDWADPASTGAPVCAESRHKSPDILKSFYHYDR